MSKCREFKIGDKVTLNADSEWASEHRTNPVGVVGTVDGVNRGGTLDVYVQWPDGSNGYASADLTLADTTDERQALSDAMDLCVDHGVRVGNLAAGGQFWHESQKGMGHFSKDRVLGLVFPLETPAQKKLKELEKKQLLIADEMKKLREGMV
jgi:hypothetical protein